MDAAAKTAAEAQRIAGRKQPRLFSIDIRNREGISKALREVVATYGGLDILINTAAVFPSSPDGVIHDEQWGTTLDINVTANHRLRTNSRKSFASRIWMGALCYQFCECGGTEAR